ncbi:hypothetical protein Rsub_07286 [Raphidocelis subcapitata]|uniref:Uncharacterized protein n=1 Tax=Raphidocelis subcapitata TaxID=307507 RepID=A0A2V0P2B6_9CHLO|nr:hypothetical protein Rsub_07286 [Raphidocelis subcapitata]|eukprot:GBF94018.1 hypothetical protein Rsub_07286 [Raphidocelis subcapitata]
MTAEAREEAKAGTGGGGRGRGAARPPGVPPLRLPRLPSGAGGPPGLRLIVTPRQEAKRRVVRGRVLSREGSLGGGPAGGGSGGRAEHWPPPGWSTSSDPDSGDEAGWRGSGGDDAGGGWGDEGGGERWERLLEGRGPPSARYFRHPSRAALRPGVEDRGERAQRRREVAAELRSWAEEVLATGRARSSGGGGGGELEGGTPTEIGGWPWTPGGAQRTRWAAPSSAARHQQSMAAPGAAGSSASDASVDEAEGHSGRSCRRHVCARHRRQQLRGEPHQQPSGAGGGSGGGVRGGGVGAELRAAWRALVDEEVSRRMKQALVTWEASHTPEAQRALQEENQALRSQLQQAQSALEAAESPRPLGAGLLEGVQPQEVQETYEEAAAGTVEVFSARREGAEVLTIVREGEAPPVEECAAGDSGSGAGLQEAAGAAPDRATAAVEEAGQLDKQGPQHVSPADAGSTAPAAAVSARRGRRESSGPQSARSSQPSSAGAPKAAGRAKQVARPADGVARGSPRRGTAPRGAARGAGTAIAAAAAAAGEQQQRIAQAEAVMAALRDDLQTQMEANADLRARLDAAEAAAAEAEATKRNSAPSADACVEAAAPESASLACQTSEAPLQPAEQPQGPPPDWALALAEAQAAALVAQQEAEAARGAAVRVEIKVVVEGAASAGGGGAPACGAAGAACPHEARCQQLAAQLAEAQGRLARARAALLAVPSRAGGGGSRGPAPLPPPQRSGRSPPVSAARPGSGARRETLRAARIDLARLADGGGWLPDAATLAGPGTVPPPGPAAWAEAAAAAAGGMRAASGGGAGPWRRRPGSASPSSSPRRLAAAREDQRARAAAARRLLQSMLGLLTARRAAPADGGSPPSPSPGRTGARSPHPDRQQQQQRPRTRSSAAGQLPAQHDWAWIERTSALGGALAPPGAAQQCLSVRPCSAAAAVAAAPMRGAHAVPRLDLTRIRRV